MATDEREGKRRRRRGTAEADPLVGRSLSGYKVEKVFAQGGMSVLYLARGEGRGAVSRVAVKVLGRSLCSDASFRRRFLQEARVASRLDHPNIVSTLDVGQVDGRLYTINEFIDGPTLKELMQRNPVREFSWCLPIVAKVASALAAIHGHGIIHRDLKPENVLMAPGGEPKLIDFGIAKDLSVRGMGVQTVGGMILGSPSYMAPEQVTGGDVSPATDLYSLGVLFFELVTGHTPFEGEGKVMLRKIREDPEAPSRLRPDLPPWVDALVLDLLVRDPEKRLDDAGELLARLEAVSAELGSIRAAAGGGRRDPRNWHWALSLTVMLAMVALNIVLWLAAR